MTTENKTYTKEEIRSACGKATDYTFDFDYIDLLQNLTERAIESGDVIDAIDEGMIYTADQWTAYKHFCNPGDDIAIMWEQLTNDVFAVVGILTEGDAQ